jgi:hypothetical protein
MNFNVASQNQGLVAWDGAAATPIDLRHHVNFAFTFSTVAPIGADTVFEFERADPSQADPCVPGPWTPVLEVLTCMSQWGAVPTNHAGLIIPNGTPAGSICSGTLPCKPGAFIRAKAGAGEPADVRIVAILGGPK